MRTTAGSLSKGLPPLPKFSRLIRARIGNAISVRICPRGSDHVRGSPPVPECSRLGAGGVPAAAQQRLTPSHVPQQSSECHICCCCST
ncbi:hypothetical protein GDO81_027410 [Engystomops pustulosus]|uniref:Uncharacterized protein n=1 Tax=Engystomops pustulosus TaxID=76066 RepID=A0AAV6YQ91_ENGPU|nr:hypothetical protein GDO81_027410 [Engystomops pustulosus]